MPSVLSIAKIKVGRRHRKAFGDLRSLADSIAGVGLLHPVVVTPSGRLIAGERRLRAARLLGWRDIPVRIIDLDDIVKGEHAENVHRLNFLPSEAVAISKALEPLERRAAKERQRLSPGRGQKGRSISPPLKGRALDKVAKVVGRHRTTLAKAKAIVDAAEADPTYAPLVEQMDRTGKVDGIFRELRQRQERAANYEQRITNACRVADLRALAESGFRAKVIYVDPPTLHQVYNGEGKMRSAERRYNTMTLDELKALGPLVRSLAARNCVLFYWASGATNAEALDVIRSWGFEPRTWAFVWVKTTPRARVITLDGKGLHWGMGSYTRANIEVVLLATRGSPRRLANDVHQVVIAPVGEHSAKPEEVRKRIERLYGGSYLELFGRRVIKGWTVFGNEVPRETLLEAAE